jgi:DNA polymerase III epsilon subunit-like protein
MSNKMRTYSSLVSCNGNLLCAIDLETTGTQPGFHEIIQVAIVPLDSDIRPVHDIPVFYHNMKPKFPRRASRAATAKHGISIEELVLQAPEPEKIEDMLVEWFNNLDLPFGKVLMPLAHNWAFESSFLKAWLGVEMVDRIFHSHARDGMLAAVYLNDRAAFAGEPLPFNRVGLGSVCNKFGLTNTHAHDALADSYVCAEAYRAMCLGMRG